MNEDNVFQITIKEWLNFLEVEINVTSNHISLMNSIITEKKTITASVVSLSAIGILAVIGASALTELPKIGLILLSLLTFFLFMLYNFKYWDKEFLENYEISHKHMTELEVIIAEIIDGKLKNTTEVKQEFDKIMALKIKDRYTV